MAKKENTCTFGIVIIVIVASLLVYRTFSEGFGASQPGSRVQLSTSHVPTRAEIDDYNSNCGKQVRSDITNLTGADPGEIVCSPF